MADILITKFPPEGEYIMSRFLAVYEQDQEKSDNFIIRTLKSVYKAIKKAVEWVVELIKKAIRKIKNYINGVNENNFGKFKIGGLYFDHDKRNCTEFMTRIEATFTANYGRYLLLNTVPDASSFIDECNELVDEMDTNKN